MLFRSTNVGFLVNFTRGNVTQSAPISVDLFSFGYKNDGVSQIDRVNNAIYRAELEETGDNTSTFTGTMEYIMLSQINIFDSTTYTNLRTGSNQIKFVVNDNLEDKKAPRVSYNDLGSDGVVTQISTQQNAPTH